MLDNLKKYKVILASNSPRRKELLSGLGVDYEIRTLPDVDESYPDTLRVADIPLYIAKEKYVAVGRTDDNCRYYCLVGWQGTGKAKG